MILFIKKIECNSVFIDVLIQSGYTVEIKNHSDDYYALKILIDTDDKNF